MKSINNKFLALLMITSVAFLSCKKEDPLAPMRANGTTTPSKTSIAANNSFVNEADWKISSYQAGGSNQVKIFSPYLFEFDKEGIIVAITRNSTTTGTWVIGSKGNADKLTINFPDENPLNKLNGEWHIVNRTAIELSLEKLNSKYMEKVTFQRYQRQAEPEQLN